MKNIATAVQLALAGSVALTSGNVLAQDSTNESADVVKFRSPVLVSLVRALSLHHQ